MCPVVSGAAGQRAAAQPSLATAPPVVPYMAAERAGRRELTELVTDHRLGDEHWHVLAAIVHRDRVAEHRRDDHRSTRPRLDDILGTLAVLCLHLLNEVEVHERALLKATWHYLLLLPLLLAAPSGAELVTWLVRPPGAPLRLAPGANRVPAAWGLALAAAHRVIDRVHRDPADAWPAALPAAPACLAELEVALLGIADFPDGRPAGRVHEPDLPGWHPQVRMPAFLGEQLDSGARRPRDLGPAAGAHLNRVHHGASRDRAQRQAVARLDVGAVPVLHNVALPHAGRSEDVALLAVGVVQQRDPGGPVRVVFNVRDLGGNAGLVRAPEVNLPVGALVPAALVPRGDLAVHVPAAVAVQRPDERLLRLVAGQLGEVRAARAAPARRGRLVPADAHVCLSSYVRRA